MRTGGPPLCQAAHESTWRERTARASLYLYNDETDVDTLADALADAGDFFAF